MTDLLLFCLLYGHFSYVKKISDLSRLLRVMFVTCLIFFQFLREKSKKRNFCFLTFCFEVLSEIGLHSKMLVFSKFFNAIFRFGS